MIIKETIVFDTGEKLSIFIDAYRGRIHDLTAVNMSEDLDLIMRNLSHNDLKAARKCMYCHCFNQDYAKEIIDILTRY